MFKAVSRQVTYDKPLISGSYEVTASRTLNDRSGETKDPDPQECLAQVGRLVNSPLLQGSEALCKLLQYLAQHTLNSPADHLKEYQIATEVFGRPTDFDPQSDSSVRVQVGRLRGKLAGYYKSLGIDDPVVIDIPRGRYALSFDRRTVTTKPEASLEIVSDSSASKKPQRIRPRIAPVLATIAGVLLISGVLLYSLHPHSARSKNADRAYAALQTFWSPFLHGKEEPFVIFSNATFIGDAEAGMRYFKPDRDSRDHVTQHYTGVGEVMGVLELDRLFQKFGSQFHIKRSGLFTLDDARGNNLIFVGSPMENLTLKQIPGTRDFVFRRLTEGQENGQEAIIDLHPPPGGTNTFLSTPRGRPMDVDYAVVALMRGLDLSRWTLVLAGTSTIGTQAAVDYVCDEASLKELLRRLNIAKGAELKPFEALLRIKVANDVPLETQLLILRLD